MKIWYLKRVRVSRSPLSPFEARGSVGRQHQLFCCRALAWKSRGSVRIRVRDLWGEGGPMAWPDSSGFHRLREDVLDLFILCYCCWDSSVGLCWRWP